MDEIFRVPLPTTPQARRQASLVVQVNHQLSGPPTVCITVYEHGVSFADTNIFKLSCISYYCFNLGS